MEIDFNQQEMRVLLSCLNTVRNQTEVSTPRFSEINKLHEKVRLHYKNEVIEKQKYDQVTDRYVILLKPNYKAKDGTIKKAIEAALLNGDGYMWLAPKNDLNPE